MKKLINIFRSFLQGIFPEKCLACDEILTEYLNNLPFCRFCYDSIISVEKPFCEVCGLPFDQGINRICEGCLIKNPFFDKARALYVYGGAIKDAIHKFKYEKRWYYGKIFGKLMADFLSLNNFGDFEIIIPVPLHKTRLKERGYNQSYELSKTISSERRIKLICSVLKRIKRTTPQMNLSFKERKINVQEAFCVKNASRIKGKNILLVDDVLTTGTTLSECAKVLKMAGGGEVFCFTIARVDV